MTDTQRMQESRELAMKAAKVAAQAIGGYNAGDKIALAAVYAEIYRADVIRAQGSQ